MAFITCSICENKSYQGADIDICRSCIENGNDTTKLLAIRKYLEKHPNDPATKVGLILHIRSADMNRFIENGSLILKTNEKGETTFGSTPEEEKTVKSSRREEFLKNYSEYQKKTQQPSRAKSNSNSQLVRDLNNRISESSRKSGNEGR